MPVTINKQMIPESEEPPRRPVWRSLLLGFRRRCPNCGHGALMTGYLKVADRCEECGEAFFYHRVDDAPAYFTILIVTHIVVPLVLIGVAITEWPTWAHTLLWPSIACALVAVLLPRIKAALVALQWALRMHGFGDEADLGPAAWPQA